MDELSVDELVKFIKDFNNQLRALAERRGRSLRSIAKESGYAVSTLSAQLSSPRLPSNELLTAFVKACGGDVEDWLKRRDSLIHLLGDTGKNLERKSRGRSRNTLDETTHTVRLSSPGMEMTIRIARDLRSTEFMTQVPGDRCIIDIAVSVRPAPNETDTILVLPDPL